MIFQGYINFNLASKIKIDIISMFKYKFKRTVKFILKKKSHYRIYFQFVFEYHNNILQIQIDY
ncbi:hypothetical protein BpHYR1_023627 [Brachionus plicatilis]|uniref:Uncharacterized protein n=1 Tax=Brachionus plicatilis TaxID=10195 RepID=A0A3M7PN00_BRAPC|nr:hypothetical protein BpHYR1_023627 [Brachionus plicatilis]